MRLRSGLRAGTSSDCVTFAGRRSLASLTTVQMMRPHRRYLTIYAGSLLLILVGTGIWSHVMTRATAEFARLYRYQVSKLDHFQGPLDTLFVGDSSLGNAIDAASFSKISGSRVVNLALTGAYGYAGSLNMIRRALRSRTPRNVVIMHTADMLTRGNEHLAYLLTAEPGEMPLPLRTALPAYLEYLALILDPKVLVRNVRHSLTGVADANIGATDYVAQRKPIRVTAQLLDGATPRAPHNAEKLHYLREIASICAARHLNCVYAHGPLLDDICVRSEAYLRTIAEVIRSTGLTPVPGTPLCMPADEAGDAVDHVRPSYKLEYTRRYAALLATLLK